MVMKRRAGSQSGFREKDAEAGPGPQPKSCSQCPGAGWEGQTQPFGNKPPGACGAAG